MMDITRLAIGCCSARCPVLGSDTTSTALYRANTMDRAATEAVPSMTAPMPTKMLRSEPTCSRISVSAPPRTEKKLDILFLGVLFRVLFLMGKIIFLYRLGKR
ncbi:hypothetical protein AM609_00495 [Actinomyces sp. oral taxon 414]|nr:hypothetical protein AM609_00495 [Actinomyces sp. oral taxon 414]